MNVESLPRFPRSSREFEATRLYWEQLIRGILEDPAASNWEQPWFTEPKKKDDSPYLEDKYYRFYSAVNFEERKGFEINQFEDMDSPGIAVWFERFGDPDKNETIERLVINTVLSKKNEIIIMKITRAYVIDNSSKEQMQKHLQQAGLHSR